MFGTSKILERYNRKSRYHHCPTCNKPTKGNKVDARCFTCFQDKKGNAIAYYGDVELGQVFVSTANHLSCDCNNIVIPKQVTISVDLYDLDCEEVRKLTTTLEESKGNGKSPA